MPGALQPGRDGVDSPDVRRDILPRATVTPGGRLDQRAVPVNQVDGQPVDLQLTQVRTGAAELGNPVRPAAQVLIGEDVIQAEQPLEVLDRSEQGEHRPVHGLGRRVGRAQIRVLLLERAQLAHLGVVVDVGDRGRIEDVVPVIGLGDVQAEVGVPPPRVRGRGSGSGVRPPCPLAVLCLVVLAHLGLAPCLFDQLGQHARRLAAPGQRGARLGRGRAGQPAGRRDHRLLRARRQRQPQPPPQPDDPLRGLRPGRRRPAVRCPPAAGRPPGASAAWPGTAGTAPVSSPSPASAASATPSSSPRRSWLRSKDERHRPPPP